MSHTLLTWEGMASKRRLCAYKYTCWARKKGTELFQEKASKIYTKQNTQSSLC